MGAIICRRAVSIIWVWLFGGICIIGAVIVAVIVVFVFGRFGSVVVVIVVIVVIIVVVFIIVVLIWLLPWCLRPFRRCRPGWCLGSSRWVWLVGLRIGWLIRLGPIGLGLGGGVWCFDGRCWWSPGDDGCDVVVKSWGDVKSSVAT